ncbi:MAG: hypothetical protein M0Q24_03730 [Sulfurimonas sp.]|uniref:hypothetical protein n=1 Tax=Sulfurimonas sp. TaxID=2022749 RepID=UPI0025D967C5|nr:hypothetical protein [Sulfurimonas sp.]MCK9491179.1 hypothetical protein [Sulfurimonas sp.]
MKNRFLLYSVILYSIILYLFVNIKNINEGSSGLVLLGMTLLLGILLILYEAYSVKKLYCQKSFFLFILFISYFIYRIVCDMENMYFLKAFTVSTTSGIVLFYFLGIIVSFVLSLIKGHVLKKKESLKIFNIFFFAFSLVILIVFIMTYSFLSSFMSEKLFLITILNGNYQRPGTFLSIAFLIYSVFYMLFIVLNNKFKNEYKLLVLFLSIAYIGAILGAILLSQMIASNNALVTLVGMLFLTLVFLINIYYFKIEYLMENKRIILKNILFNKTTLFLLISIVIVFVTIIIIFVGMVLIFDIDLSRFRIFGFGAEQINSITARIELWKNFTTHFKYSPFFGNMAVDRLTTGDGTYVHSFLGSLLTHLGVVGFVLFFSYLYFAFKELLNIEEDFIENKLITLYLSLLYLGIFAIAIFGVHVSWIPLWFLLGMIFPVFKFKNRKEDIV